MRKALATIGCGPMEPVLAEAFRTYLAYAARHGYDIVVGGAEHAGGRPLAWGKVALIRGLLDQYDLVLWIDADAIFLDDSVDAADLLPPHAFQGLVEHRVGNHFMPNTGVWVVRGNDQARRFLDEVWTRTDFIDDQWWDNAAVMDVLGYSIRPSHVARASLWRDATCWLEEEWNSHVSISKVLQPRIRHYAGRPNWYRLSIMRAVARPTAANRIHARLTEVNWRARVIADKARKRARRTPPHRIE